MKEMEYMCRMYGEKLNQRERKKEGRKERKKERKKNQ